MTIIKFLITFISGLTCIAAMLLFVNGGEIGKIIGIIIVAAVAVIDICAAIIINRKEA